MRLLFESASQEELSTAKRRLEKRGISVFVSSERTYHLWRPYTAGKRGLWVCLEQHYEDARVVLRDPGHREAHPVDVQDFYRTLEEASRQPLAAMGIDPHALLNLIAITVVLLGSGALLWAIFG